MADLLIEQLCKCLAENLQTVPITELNGNDLVTYLEAVIESDALLKAMLTEKAVQINQGDATGYQVLVESGKAYIGEHFLVNDRRIVEAALETILKAYLSKPVGTPSNLPLSGVVKFIGRDESLAAVHEKLQGSTTVAISSVSGMGGVGKTELALQYAYTKLKEDAYSGGICWVNARAKDVGIGILEFARDQLGLPEPPEILQTVPERVKWVCGRWQSEPILIVLDDVTAYEVVEPYLQQLDPRFRVLMTTRLKLGTPAQRLELEVLTEDAALELLRVLIDNVERIDSQLADAQELCEWLGYLPLGLELVGRYLTEDEDISLAEMLELLQQERLAAEALLEAHPEMTASLGVATAFELSWKELDADAKKLSGLLSIFALAPIPWELVEQCLSDWEKRKLAQCRDQQLKKRSLLARVAEKRYQLHQLIREFFTVKREQMVELKTACLTVLQVIEAKAKEITNTSERSLYEEMASVIPHLQEVITHVEKTNQQEEILVGISRLAHLYEQQGRYIEAEPLYNVLAIQEQELGDDYLSVPTRLIDLAYLYQLQGRYSEAEPLYKRSLALREQYFGNEHPSVSAGLSELALLYYLQGCYSEAETCCVRGLTIQEKQFEHDHPDVVHTLGYLALIYKAQGRYSEAESLYVRVLSIQEQRLGHNHFEIAVHLNNLANLYLSQARYREVEPVCKRALKIWKHQLGPNHPYIANGCKTLATLYQSQGLYKKAESLFKKVLAICEQRLGYDHPYVATSLNNLAGLYLVMERLDDAERLYTNSIALSEQRLGHDHPNVADSLNSLALLYCKQGRYEEAKSLTIRSLQIKKAQLGSDHPDTATSLNTLAEAYRGMVCYDDAESCCLRALQIRQTKLGTEHPTTAISLNSLARLYESMGHYSDAEPLYLQSLDIQENSWGIEHPNTQKTQNNLRRLIQQLIQSNRVGELSDHPVTQGLLREIRGR